MPVNLNSDKNTEAWLILSLCPELSTAAAQKLILVAGDATAAIKASSDERHAAGISPTAAEFLRNPDEARLRRASDWLSGDKRCLLGLDSERYPPLLIESGEAPLCLFVEGDPDLLSLPQLAIVGSRKATVGGRETARSFAAYLADAGLTITSGLAEGIDTEAHTGALQTGQTVAVLGTGPDEVYPRQNQQLAERIAAQGVLVTEFAPGTPVSRDHFPRRNRIISGLSLGVLVVEAGLRSGSLITARYSGNYGREIFAIPGSIHNPLSKGCHRLIREGARLVESAQDIVSELGALAGALEAMEPCIATQTTSVADTDPDYAKLLEAMGYDPVSVNQLAERSGLTAEQLSSMLLILELEGRVNTVPGGYFQQASGGRKPNE